MPKSNRTYASLDGPSNNGPEEDLEWYWRIFAFAASWMILAGFITLQPLLDHESSKDGLLRVGRGVLIALSVSLLAAGFVISLLVFLVCTTSRQRFDVVSLPGLTSTSLGLFTLLYPLAISDRFSAGGSAGLAGVVVATVSTVVYVCLTVFTYHRSARPTSPRQSRLPLRNLFSSHGSNNTAYQAPTEYQGFYAPGRNTDETAYGEAPVHIIQRPPTPVEEQATRQQMSRLLQDSLSRSSRQSQTSIGDTYHIDWQSRPDQNTQTPLTPAAPAAFLGTTSIDQKRAHDQNRDSLDMPPHVQQYFYGEGGEHEGGEREHRRGDSVSEAFTGFGSSPAFSHPSLDASSMGPPSAPVASSGSGSGSGSGSAPASATEPRPAANLPITSLPSSRYDPSAQQGRPRARSREEREERRRQIEMGKS